MKVVYETILQSVTRVIRASDSNGKRIEHIELTHAEWDDFKRQSQPGVPDGLLLDPAFYSGVRITKGEY